MENRTCYLMVTDLSAKEGEAALEWGVSYGLEEGETLPEDVEELTEAQFTVFQMLQMLKGVFAEATIKEIIIELIFCRTLCSDFVD